jgi:hypothetical protein
MPDNPPRRTELLWVVLYSRRKKGGTRGQLGISSSGGGKTPTFPVRGEKSPLAVRVDFVVLHVDAAASAQVNFGQVGTHGLRGDFEDQSLLPA